MAMDKWADYFDNLASRTEDYEKVGLSRWGSNAVYRTAELHMYGRVLDIGCGSGNLAKRNHKMHIVGVDISPKQLEEAKKYCKETYQASIADLPFPDKSFDTVLSLAVIQNCSVPLKRQFSEMYRLSRDIVFVSGLSEDYEKETDLKTYDPTEVLKTFAQVFKKARGVEWGAIKYDKDRVWTEDWCEEGAGLFYIVWRAPYERS